MFKTIDNSTLINMLPLNYIVITKVMPPPFHLGTIVETPSKSK